MKFPVPTRRDRKRSMVRLNYQTLESRRLLAASLDASDFGTGDQSDDYETDQRLIGMFLGPRIPGRPIPRIQGIALRADAAADDDFPIAGDEPGSDGAEDSPLQVPPFTTDQTFKLHSRPDSNFTIYLDFDGHTTVGTTWNSQYGQEEIVHPNYWGGTGSNFSNTRLELIQEIWQVVAEDFAPFDVNVTTEEPSDTDDLRYSGSQDTRWGSRVVLTKDTFAECGCGGHAYLGAFDDREDEPALVYNGGLGAGSETVSHEVGHQLGLNHDGVGSTTYYGGHGSGDTSWGPIMGSPFSKRTTQWNNGDYFNASNTGQDDLSVINRSVNFPYVPDDHADDRLLASPLEESNSTDVEAFGIIEKNDDVDWFRFTTGGGNISLDIDVLGYKPNLDAWAGLYDASGVFLVDSNPQTELSATLQDVALEAGEYFIKIDGVPRDGTYDPLLDEVVEPTPAPYSVSGPAGYSDYGSLGQYRISGTIIAPDTPSVSVVAVSPIVVEGNDAAFTLTASDGGDTDLTIMIRPIRQTAPGLPAPNSTEDADFGAALTQVISIADGTATVQIPILDDALIEGAEYFEIEIVDAGSYAIADRVARAEVNESKTSYAIFATDAVTFEGDVANGATHQFTVKRNGRKDLAQTVGWRRIIAGNEPADESDFTSSPTGTIDFGIDETTQTINVGIAGDIESEADETYAVELFVPTGESFQIESATNSAEGRIDDDESTISLGAVAQFRLRQVKFGGNKSDNWAFDNFRISGTAISDDFDPETDNANWADIDNGVTNGLFPQSDGNALFFTGAGVRAATTIPVAPPTGATVDFSIIFADRNGNGLNATENGDDAVLEYSLNGIDWTEIERFDESVYDQWTEVSVPLPEGATFAPTLLTEGDSGINTQSIPIQRSGYIAKAISVDWVVTPTGIAPVTADDFAGGFPTGTTDFSAGQSVAMVELPIAGETAIEPDETFLLSLTSNSGGPIRHPTLTGSIINDDFLSAEINVRGGNDQSIADGDLEASADDGTDFGLAEVEGSSRSQTFTIENLGVLDLEVNSIWIDGTHPNDFSVTKDPDTLVAPGETTTFEVAFSPTAPGRRDALIEIENNDPNESYYSFAVSALGTDLGVQEILINDGQLSRSQIKSVKVSFNQIIDHQLLVDAFQVRNLSLDQSVRSIIATPDDVDNRTEVLLTFENQNFVPAILVDGNYELRVVATAIKTVGTDSYPMLDDHLFGTEAGVVSSTDAFFRHFGDTDGDRDVDGQDYGRFGLAFLQDASSPNFDDQLDSDGDNDVDGQDYSRFAQRFLRTLGTHAPR